MKGKTKKADGGAVDKKPLLVAGNPNVVKEAEERKKGGKCGMKMGGKAVPPRLDKRRRTGGRVGSDSSPLSSAHKVSKAEPVE